MPGVHITEREPFAGETAMPAFVGYTERAEIDGTPAFLIPIRIDSLDEFRLHFGGPPKSTFDIVIGTADDFDVITDDDVHQKLKPTGPMGLLYYSLCLFYANGGGRCVVVSVGPYESAVSAPALKKGLVPLEDHLGPTLLVIPDLSLLPITKAPDGTPKVEGFKDVASAMLAQCVKTQDRVALLDVVHARDIDSPSLAQLSGAVENFRVDIESESLSYGIAYFPYLNTSFVQVVDLEGRLFEHAAPLASPFMNAD